ncbi:MAG: HEAT repeat domain-containing protein, partial [Planctomycetes bacterium]|nr:HEAT repeat domain-containing protein [Planctomycetota bacterium]
MNRQTLLRCGMLLASAVAMLVVGTAARGDAYQDIVTYTWDQPRTTPASIEEDIRAAATPAAQKAIEVKLIKALSSPQATYECKQFVCRMLRQMGSAACVPALAKLLPDEKLSHMARFALQGLACEQAGDALRQAMDRLDGVLKRGMISSVGQRRDAKAVPALAKYAASDLDPDLAIAAIGALGHIATPEAAKVLAGLKVPRMLGTWCADARLCCADAMLAGDNAAEAAAIYKAMFAEGQTKPIRVAALRGLVMAQKEAAVATLVGLLKNPDVEFTRAATQFLIEMPGAAATKAIAGQLASASPEAQVALIDVLTARADTAAAAQVTALTDSKDETVRLAALRALAALGDVSSVPVLAKAASAGGKEGAVALDSLNRLRGEGVGEAMGKLLDSPDPVIRAGILGVMTVRNDKSMAPAMVKAAGNADANIRKTAIAGLAALAGEKELPDVVALLAATKDEAERSALERALASAAGRAASPDAAAAPIVDGLAKADAVAKVPLLTVLGEVGGAK